MWRPGGEKIKEQQSDWRVKWRVVDGAVTAERSKGMLRRDVQADDVKENLGSKIYGIHCLSQFRRKVKSDS